MLDTAIAAAQAAGAIQRRHYGQLLNVDLKSRNDVKLEVDRLCEEAIVGRIRAAYPDHSILAEERGAVSGNGEYRWVIDPLDGTVNFFYGLPFFCTCVACYRQSAHAAFPLGEPVAGVVYCPPLDELFVGEPGAGATLNGRPIRASGVTELAESIVATGYGSAEVNIRHLRRVQETLVDRVRKLRIMGAAGLDMCNVAAGRLSAYYERGIRSWDIGAPYVILREAGAEIRAAQYAPDTWEVLASAPGIFAELSPIVAYRE